jgi:N-acetylglucosamine-6-sulfatase
MAFSLYGLLALAICFAVAASIHQQPLSSPKKKPNIVFILTDDQDIELGSLDYMPLVHKHLINEGTLFKRHYCTTAICCPSRVTLWTGKNAHNTNVTDIFPPYGQLHLISLSNAIRICHLLLPLKCSLAL